jgi:hypothetical protein
MENKTLDYQDHIKLWESSGISKVAYCKEHSLTYSTFFYHLKRKKRTKAPKKFMELKIKDKEQSPKQDAVEIYLANGSRLVFATGSSSRFMHEVIFGC